MTDDLHSAWEQRQGQRELRDAPNAPLDGDLRAEVLRLSARVVQLEAALAAVTGTLANPPAQLVDEGPVSLTHEAPSAPPHKE